MRRRILITGSTGMLGTALVEKLRAANKTPSPLSSLPLPRGRGRSASATNLGGRGGSDTAFGGGEGDGAEISLGALKDYDIFGVGRRDRSDAVMTYARCDLTDGAQTSRVIRDMKPDIIIHAAAMTDVDGCEKSPEEAFRINRDATRNVLDTVKGQNVLLVFVSTDYVFDGASAIPYREEDGTSPLNIYGRSKLEAEESVRQEGGSYVIVRSSWLFGPHGKNFVDTVLRLAERDLPLKVVDDQRGRPTYTGDLAGAVDKLIGFYAERTRKVAEIFHVANEGSVSWFEFAKEIIRRSGKTASIEPISSRELGGPAKRPANSVLDTARYDSLTKAPLRSWKEALHDYLVLRQKTEVSM